MKVFVEDKKGTYPISSICQKCAVCTPPDRAPLYGVQTTHKYLSHMGFSNIKDTIIYDCEENNTSSDVTRFRETSADYSLLCTSIDRCLWDYMLLQAKISDTCLNPISLSLSDRLDVYSHKVGLSKREIYLPFPRKSVDGRLSSLFANNAYVDIICKQLFVRTDATTKVLSPQYICTFFAQTGLPEIQAKNPTQYSTLSLEPFTLEDYVYYEMVTGVSLCVETSAALSLVDNPDIRNVCLEVLKKNFPVLLMSHYLFGRIAFMRQFVMNASSQIEGTVKYHSQSESLEHSTQIDIAQKIWNSMIYDWQCHPMQMDCCTLNIEEGPKYIVDCKDSLISMINRIKAPVNLALYIQNPIYGPVAFCNPKHPGITPFLRDLEHYNGSTGDTHTPEYWNPFLRLCEISRTFRLSQNNDEREHMKLHRKLYRSRPSKKKYSSTEEENTSTSSSQPE